MGMLFWGSTGLITGWATARFGWYNILNKNLILKSLISKFFRFGLNKEVPSNQILNYIGVAMALISAIFYLFVKSETQTNERNTSSFSRSNKTGVLDEPESKLNPTDSLNSDEEEKDFIEKLNPTFKRILGTGLAIFSGVMYGQSNTPILYTTAHSGGSGNYLDYLFSYYTGILITSLVYFIIYCIVKK